MAQRPTAANEVAPLNLQDTPTIPMLTYMPTQCGGEIKIIERIGAEYTELGTLLLKDDTGGKINTLVASHPQQPGLICRSILSSWLRGVGREPVIWATLIDVLKQAGLKQLAQDIEKQAKPSQHIHSPASPAENESSAEAQSSQSLLTTAVPHGSAGSLLLPQQQDSQQCVGTSPSAGQVQEQQERESVGENGSRELPLVPIIAKDEVEKMIAELKQKFRKLKSAVLKCLETHRVLVNEVADVLTQLSPDDDKQHRMFLKSNMELLNRATDNSELFRTLNLHWNYLDPSLLDRMANDLELEEVKGEMDAYKSDLQKFRKKIPLTVFCASHKKRKRELPPNFKKIVADFNWTGNVTLEIVEQFRQEYASHYGVHEFAMMIAQVRPGSFIITLFIPESIVEKLKESDNVPREILEKYSVTKLKVAGTIIYPYLGEEEDEPIDEQSSVYPVCSRSDSEVTASSSEEFEESSDEYTIVIPHSKGASAPDSNAPSMDSTTEQTQGEEMGGTCFSPSPTPRSDTADLLEPLPLPSPAENEPSSEAQPLTTAVPHGSAGSPLPPHSSSVSAYSSCEDLSKGSPWSTHFWSNLLDLIKYFGDNTIRLVDEKVTSLKNSDIKDDSKIKTAFEDVCAVSQQADIFVAKVENIFRYGKETEDVKEALRERGDMQPLIKLFEMLKRDLAEAEQKYIIFEERYKKASQSCLEVVEMCRQKSEDAEKNKERSVVAGGTADGGVGAGGAALVAISIAVGVLTGVVGIPVVLVVGAAGAGTAAAAGAVATAATAHHYHKVQVTFGELAKIFNATWLATLNMKQDIDKIKSHVQRIQDSVKDVEFSRVNKHTIDAIHALDRQQEMFTNYRDVAASFRERLMEKNRSLIAGVESIIKEGT